MTFHFRAAAVVALGLAAVQLLGGAGCASDSLDLSPACAALNNCCSSPNFSDQAEAVSCQETAMSAGLSEAGCSTELEELQQQGECVDAGPD